MKPKNNSNKIPMTDGAPVVFPVLNVDALPVSIMVFQDSDPYHLAYMNNCMLCELGYQDQQELERHVGISLLSFVHPDDCDFFRKYVLSINEQHQEPRCRCRIRKKDYSYLWYEIEVFPPCEGTDAASITCACKNISELFDLQTSHAKNELKLQDARSELESIIENLPGGWHICRLLDGISLYYASEGLCQICGYTRKEIKELFNNQYALLIHEDDRHLFLNAIKELAEYPHSTELEYRIVHKNGSVIWVSDRMKSSRNREGIMFVYAVVTESGKWHTAWQKVQSLVDTTPCGIVMFEYRKVDEKVTIKLFNDAACNIASYSRDAFEQLDIETIGSSILAADYGEVERQFKNMIETGVDMNCVFRFKVKDSIFWAHMITRVIEQYHGSYLINAAFVDFTEKKQLEEQLSYQTYCLDKIDKSLSSGIIIKQLGLENMPQYLSGNILNLLGYSMQEAEHISESGYKDVIYPDDYQRIIDTVAQHKANETQHFEIEFRFIKKDGSLIWVKEAADRLDDFAVEEAYLIVFTDITDLKDAEMQLRMREEEYRIAVSHSKNVIVRYNIAERTIYIPKEMAIQVDLPERIEDVPYQIIQRGFIRPVSIESYSKLFECANRGENYSTEIAAEGAGGKEYWFQSVSTVVFDDRHIPASAIILFSDITEQKQTEKVMNGLKEAEQLFQIIVESSNKLLLRYNFASHSFEPYGPAAQTLFSNLSTPYTFEKIISTNLFEKKKQNDLYAFYMQMKNGAPKGTTLIKVKNHDAQWGWYECSFITIFDSQNLPQYAVVFCEDVTTLRENKLASQRFKDAVKPGSRGIEVNLEYNLTTDTFESMDGEWPTFFHAMLTGSYTSAILQIAQYIPSDTKNEFVRRLSRDSLLAAFEAGANSDTIEILVGDEGETMWIQLYYQILKEPYTDQISIWLSFRNIDDKKKNELKLVEMAQIDAVTGIYNRVGLKAKVEEKRHIIDEGAMSLFIMLDIDGFGRINDTFGHVYGDQLLRELAQTLKLLLNENNIVARIGGDEFAIYAFGLTDMNMVNERMRILIAAAYRDLKAGLKLSISAGVAISPKDGTDLQVLYEKADTALYYAKITGRDKYILYSDHLAPVDELPSITPIDENVQNNNGVYIRTFGYFDVFVNGEALLIQNAKAKELLVLLVDRRGGYITPSEIIAFLWEDESANKATLARCRKVVLLLRNTLREYGLENLVESQKGARRLNTNLVNCDLYNYLSGQPEYAHLFKGSYMLNYSWGEFSIAELENFQMFRQNGAQPTIDEDKL